VNDLVTPKADSVFVNNQLALKADKSALDVVSLGLTTKANQTTTYTKDETNNLLQSKGNAADVTTALNAKANKSYVDNELTLKADQTYVDTGLNLKASKTYVDLQLGQKASIGYVDDKVFEGIAGVVNTAPLALDTLKELAAALNNDSNFATSVQTQFTYKADRATTYAKTDTMSF
jgi:hypothetical protein